MKLHILSDLHNEFSVFVPPKTNADVLVLAGDIDLGTAGITWALKGFELPTIYVAGNHEFYRRDLASEVPAMRNCAAGTKLHFLECNVVVIGDVRFIGATLWTDYAVTSKSRRSVEMAQLSAFLSMNDFRLIRMQGKPFTPEESVKIFDGAVQFLSNALAEPFEGKTVVVTHHAPSAKSIHPKYVGSAINGAFSSNLEYLMKGPNAPALWIHGHTHDSFDYVVNGKTRVVANPRGYTSRHLADDQENQLFNPGLIVEV